MCAPTLADQFNELRDQLDKLSDDASYNGINLLRGDDLTITFNEIGTSTIDIQTKDGETINAGTLGLADIEAEDLDSDTNIDALLTSVKDAINTVRSQSSTFGSNLSVVENRQDFTTAMMNTLETGADNLVLADGNEETANMLALQTRQQLS
ncbi:flagellin [Breoghania sp.]|uniref:flagellin n=1 Tax=Breoghania sp. TaxID=2065378 RepID=UPI0026033A89|nr:flagellin [Breoghania sp.]MDJ0932107.1 flagellin [Breoghania sp.]